MKCTLLMAITLDGKIARTSDHFPDWTGKADKKFFAQTTKKAGALIFGRKTFETIGRPLPKRKNIVLTRSPQNSEWENLIFTSQKPHKILEDLTDEGFDEVVLAGGAEINTLFAKAGLIDEIVLTISPLIFGQGISLFTEELELSLKLLDLTKLDENLVCVRYKVLK